METAWASSHRIAAYLLLVDQRGVVRWRHSGQFDEKAYDQMASQVSDLLK